MGNERHAAAVVQAEFRACEKNEDHFFMLDTNIIVRLAEGGYSDILDKLAKLHQFIATSVNYREIEGLVEGRRLHFRARNLLRLFLRRIAGQISHVDSSGVRKELKKYVDLIPRKLVHDVLFNLPNSFVQQLIDLYEDSIEKIKKKRTSMRLTITEAMKKRSKLQDQIIPTIYARFGTLCKEHDIDQTLIDLDRHKRAVLRFLDEGLNLIREKTASVRSFDHLVPILRTLKRKSYNEDVRFAAEVIAQGTVSWQSFDSDVISLFEIHAAHDQAA